MFKCLNGLAPSYLSSKIVKASIIIKRLGLLLPIIWLLLGFLYDHIWKIIHDFVIIFRSIIVVLVVIGCIFISKGHRILPVSVSLCYP